MHAFAHVEVMPLLWLYARLKFMVFMLAEKKSEKIGREEKKQLNKTLL